MIDASAPTDGGVSGEPAPPSQSVLDLAKLESQVNGDRDMLRRLARIFIEEAPQRLGEVRAGVADGDCERVRRAAHTLRGSARQLVAPAAAAAALAVEEAAKADALAEAGDALANLDCELGKLVEVFSRLAADDRGVA